MKNLLLILVISLSSAYANEFNLTQKELVDLKLTEAEYQTMAIGELSRTRYAIGGVLGIYPGFGIGHTVQGRWRESGWKFTAGEVGSILVLFAGLSKCVGDSFYGRGKCDSQLIDIGAVGYIGFKIWEIVDVWRGGIVHRRKFQDLQNKVDKKRPKQESLNSWKFSPALNANTLAINLNYSF